MIVTFIWSITIFLLLLFLMYRECAAPFASILGSLDSFEGQLNAEADETNSLVSDTEAEEVVHASMDAEQKSQISTKNGSNGTGNGSKSKSPSIRHGRGRATVTKKKAPTRIS